MKKILLINAIAFALVGCGGGHNSSQPTTSSVSSSSASSVSSSSSSSVDPLAQWPKPISKLVTKNPAIEQKIEVLLAKMTIEEKVGQTIQADVHNITLAEVTQYHIGSVLNGGGSLMSIAHPDQYATVSDWLQIADAFYKASVDTHLGGQGIPLIWGTDALHGDNNVIGATLFPHNIALGAANDPELMRKIGEATAQEVAATGLDWTFAPTLAVVRNDRWGRTYESYSEDPSIVKAYAGNIIEGLQGNPSTADFLSDKHIIATAKHFLGDGGTTDGLDRGNTQVTEAELIKIHAQGYVSAIESGVQTVMASFSSWNGNNMHGNRYLLTDVLKNHMGFDGFVVGDWNGHEFVPGCTSNSCAAAFNAGVDMFMAPSDWKKLYENTLAQAKSGVIPQSRLDDAVRRILRVKMRAGLFNKGAPSTRALAGQASQLGSPEHRAIARQAVRESLVLLKNNNNILPIKSNSHILVAGDGANNIGKQAGGWSISWQGTGNNNSNFPGATSIYQAIANAAAETNSQATLSETGTFTQRPDVAVVVFGENPYAEMVGDVKNVDFSSNAGLNLLRQFKAQGIPTVSIFISGRPLWVNPELNASDAFVAAWLPGTEAQGIADVIISKKDNSINYDFKGKLSFSWPATPDQVSINKDDANYAPLFAYGYGLTYSDNKNITLLSEVGQPAAVTTFEIFNKQSVAPWGLFLQDFGSAPIFVSGNNAASSGILYEAQDRNSQWDTLHLQWSGKVEAVAGFGSNSPVDYSATVENAAIVFDVKVNKVTTAAVNVGAVCAAQNCISFIPITSVLQKMPINEWKSVSVSLACFAKNGIKLDALVVPFALDTAGELDLSVNHIRIESKADADIACK